MKFLFILFSIISLRAAAEERCDDIASRSNLFRWSIVQEIDPGYYEMVSVDTGSGNPNLRVVLHTLKATFNKQGFPYGIKIKKVFGSLDLPGQDGFKHHYGLVEECGIVSLPEGKVMWEPGMSVRSHLKGDPK